MAASQEDQSSEEEEYSDQVEDVELEPENDIDINVKVGGRMEGRPKRRRKGSLGEEEQR